VAGGSEFWTVLTAAAVGAVLGAALVMRWIILRERRLSAAGRGERPAAFDRVECLLSFRLADGRSTGETRRALRLTGGDEDEGPRPSLYDAARPARTLFVSEFSAPLRVDDGGRWRYGRAWPGVRMALVLLALIVPALGWFLV
jgi:hypothetical protein